MSATDYLSGIVAVLAYLGGACVVAVTARRRWFAGASGPGRAVVGIPVATAALLVPALLTGSAGVLAPIPLLVVMAGLVVAARRVAPTPTPTSAPAPAPTPASGPDASATTGGEPAPRSARWALGAAIGLVAIRWVAALLGSASRGWAQRDDLHYHLTHAAHFASSGRTWPITFDSVGDAAAFHPANSELLHGVFLALLGRDLVSLVVNLPFAVLAVCAGWQIGRRAGNAHAGAILVCAVLVLRVMAIDGGSALNDVVALGLLLAAVALLLDADRGPRPTASIALAGLAAGLAAGTKLTVLVPVVGLAAVAARRPDRWDGAAAARYTGAALLGGGYWYLRNLVHAGNPVPVLSPGPLPGPELELQRSVEFPVTEYLLDGGVWRGHLLPGLELVFGSLWLPLLLAAGLGGVACALSRRLRREEPRWGPLAVVGGASLLSYAVAPTSAAGAPGQPTLFAVNLRYALPGLLACLLAGLALPLVRRHRTWATVAALLAVLSGNAYRAAPTHATVALVVVGVAGAAWWAIHRSRSWFSTGAALPVGLVAVGLLVLAGFPLQREVLERRWRDDLPRWPLYEAVRPIADTRIALTGYPQTYPFLGDDLSNDVTTLGDRSEPDELLPLVGCEAFWSGVVGARAELVVVVLDTGLDRTAIGRALGVEPIGHLEAAGVEPLLATAQGAIYDVRGAEPAC